MQNERYGDDAKAREGDQALAQAGQVLYQQPAEGDLQPGRGSLHTQT